MSTDDLIKEAERKMGQSIEHLEQELLSIRTGRANPALIERVTVPYYGKVKTLRFRYAEPPAEPSASGSDEATKTSFSPPP